MPEPYPILRIESRGPIEDMGSKPKFWFPHDDGTMWLFKQARPNTGEHWAEKVASEIARIFDLPTHHAELACYENQAGCAVRSFLNKGSELVHGNEILGGTIDGYDKGKMRGQADHNFENIVNALEHWFPGDRPRDVAAARMVGYLVFDALVGNTDRHHENWGIVVHRIQRQGPEPDLVYGIMIAPTFDHGSCLGRELLDERKRTMLSERQAIPRYIRKARGGIFRDSDARRGLSPLALVELIAERYPKFYRPWHKRLQDLNPDDFSSILARVPEDWMSADAKEFALAFLKESRNLLLCIS